MENKQGVASEYQSGSQGSFLKGSSFDQGIELMVVGMEPYTPSNQDFGVKNQYGPGGVVTKENWFIKEGLLKEGQTFRYTFKDQGIEKIFDNGSLSFYFAFTKTNPANGDTVFIKRNMKTQTDVSWEVKVIE